MAGGGGTDSGIVGHVCSHKAEWEKQGCFSADIAKYCGPGGAGTTGAPPDLVKSVQDLAKLMGIKPADLEAIQSAAENAERAGALFDQRTQARQVADRAVETGGEDEDEILYGLSDGVPIEGDIVALLRDEPTTTAAVGTLRVEVRPKRAAITHGPLRIGASPLASGGTLRCRVIPAGTESSPPLQIETSGGAQKDGLCAAVPIGLGRARIEVEWTGANGETASGLSEEVEIVPPLLFLHGLASSTQTWDQTALAGMFGPQAIVRNGEMEKPGDIYLAGFKDNNASYISQAAEVEKWVSVILRGLPKETNPAARKVVLVGHSMGGLASRAYLEGFSPGGYGGNVAALVTIGTPHRGSILAQLKYELDEDAIAGFRKQAMKSLLARFGLPLDPDSDAVSELSVLHPKMKLLARDASKLPRQDVRYVSVVGTLAPAAAELLASDLAKGFAGGALAAGETFETIRPLIRRSDGLVDEASQDLNCLVPGIARVVRIQSDHMAETRNQQAIVDALALTGRYPFLKGNGADDPVCKQPQPLLQAELGKPAACGRCSQAATAARAEVERLIAMRRELIRTNGLLQREVALLQDAAGAGEAARVQALKDSVKVLLVSLDKLGKVTERLTARLEKAAAIEERVTKLGARSMRLDDRQKLRTFAKDFKAVKEEAEKIAFILERYLRYQEKKDPKEFLEDVEGVFERTAGVVLGVLAHAESSDLDIFDDPDFLWALAEAIGGPALGSVRYVVDYAAAVYAFVTAWEQVQQHDRNIDSYLLGLRAQAASLCRQQNKVNASLRAVHACQAGDPECVRLGLGQGRAGLRDAVCPEVDVERIRKRVERKP